MAKGKAMLNCTNQLSKIQGRVLHPSTVYQKDVSVLTAIGGGRAKGLSKRTQIPMQEHFEMVMRAWERELATNETNHARSVRILDADIKGIPWTDFEPQPYYTPNWSDSNVEWKKMESKEVEKVEDIRKDNDPPLPRPKCSRKILRNEQVCDSHNMGKCNECAALEGNNRINVIFCLHQTS